NGGGMGDAHQPGGDGESVLLIGVHQRSRDEHERLVRANQEKRGRHLPAVSHTKSRVVLGLCEQVVEGFELAWLLHRAKGRRIGLMMQAGATSPCGRPPFLRSAIIAADRTNFRERRNAWEPHE